MSTWLRELGTPGPGAGGTMQLICFPHAGASADNYLPLSRKLAPEIKVHAVQYPGRQDRRAEQAVSTAAELAEEIARAIHAAVDGPYALFGHSMGALVAYETARRLEQRPGAAGKPVRVFLSGQSAPRVHERRRDLPDDDGLLEELRRLGGSGSALDDKDLAALLLPTLRADYGVLRSYRWVPGPDLRVGVTAFCGDNDPLTTTDDAARWLEYSVIPGRTETYSGGHFYLDNQIAEVAESVRRDLLRPRLLRGRDHCLPSR